MFVCEDARRPTRRASSPASSCITGPMFGDRMRRPTDGSPAAAREDAILDARGPRRDESSRRVRAIAEGTRRDATIEVGDAGVTARRR